jgi:hypothetical protein
MIQQDFQAYPKSPARVSDMPHIAHPDDNGPQPDRGEHDWLDGAFRERSPAEQRARATQRLAALGEMAGGIAKVNHDKSISHAKVSTSRRNRAQNSGSG